MPTSPTPNETFAQEELTALATEWFAAFNRKDVAALVDLHTEDATHHSPKLRDKKPETGGIIQGRAALEVWWEEAFRTIAGLRYEIQHITAQGNRVFVEYIRHADRAEDTQVAEVYEVVKVRDRLQIAVSKVYHG